MISSLQAFKLSVHGKKASCDAIFALLWHMHELWERV